MLALLFSVAAALAGHLGELQPNASALLAPDGNYTLRFEAPIAWRSAEVVVEGGRAQLLGPVDIMSQVELSGIVDEPDDALSIYLTAVTPDGVGVSFEFEVEAELVPSITPPSDPDLARRRLWPFWRIAGPRP